ncbi:MAG: hypothetical protein ACRDSH_16430 [Pseudonocardiaceae bacterium]
MSSSRAPAAVDALVAAVTAGLPNSPVWDGPVPSGDYRDGVFIGYDGDPLGERESLASTQDWAGIGAKKRTETIDILCAVVAVDGDGVPKKARDAAYALLAAVENVLRADPSLAQTPTPFIAAVTTPRLLWDWLETAGLQARITFTVHIETRI